MRTITQLQALPGFALSHDEWLALALASKLTVAQLAWRSQVAELESILERPIQLMDDAEEQGVDGAQALLGALLVRIDLYGGPTRKRPQLGGVEAGNPQAIKVTKFWPGDHYHVHALDPKFDSLQEAIDELRRAGYSYAGLDEKYLPRVDGD